MRLNITSKILESVQELNEDTKSLSYKALREEATVKGLRTCPRCGNRIIGYPAVSRYDNKTEICSDCGTEEALENMMGYITNPNTGEKVSLEDLKAMRALENDESEDLAEEVTIDIDRARRLTEEIRQEAYLVGEAIANQFNGQELINWEDFRDAFEMYTNEINPSLLSDENLHDFEMEVRDVLSWNYGYATIYEGEYEGGLTTNSDMFKGVREINYVDDLTEEVTIDTPTQEDLDRDEENTKAMNKKDIEDKIGKLRAAMQDGMSKDEIEATEKDIAELEDGLNEGAFLDNRENLIKCFNEAWSEAKFLQAEMRFAKPSISKLRDSIPVICDNLDKLGELLKIVDSSESSDVDKPISEDALKESVDLASNSLYVKIVNELDDNIYGMEKEEAIELLKQIKKDCDVFISSLKQIRR